MHYPDMYTKIIFLIIICFSFLNFMLVMSLNKVLSLFKLLGIAFFPPLFLCAYLFLIPDKISLDLVLPLSEFCLALGVLISFIKPNNERSYKAKAAVMFVVPLLLGMYIKYLHGCAFLLLPLTAQAVITAAVIMGTMVLIKVYKYSETKLMMSLMLWASSILLRLFEYQSYLTVVIAILKAISYVSFFHYFYTTIYSSFMNKIVESEKLKESLERSLNKEVKKRVFEIERSNERLLEMSKIDLLTKAYNKVTTLNIIEKLISSKKADVFSILMFDIDNFKTINDSLGHVTGDICLKTIASIASSNIREVDFLGRYGGDEFLIILPSLSANEARFVAERFKNKVSETSNPKFTISMGIATYPYDGETVKELISAADKGLYKSKSKGKNMISHATLF